MSTPGTKIRFEAVRRLKVRREFRVGAEPGAVEVRRDCGIGCLCSGTIYKAVPNAALAESKTFCFNDGAQQGISEIAGSARLVSDAGGVKVFEVTADLVEARR